MKTQVKSALKSSKRVQPYPPLADDIIQEVYRSMELLGADKELLALIGNWIERLTTDQQVIGSTPIGCTTFPQQNDDSLDSRTVTAQNSAVTNAPKVRFPKVIRFRKIEATIYGKKPSYPFYRIAYLNLNRAWTGACVQYFLAAFVPAFLCVSKRLLLHFLKSECLWLRAKVRDV